ncbi:hypothetical protein, partial [Streptomyces sp. NPDC056512]
MPDVCRWERSLLARGPAVPALGLLVVVPGEKDVNEAHHRLLVARHRGPAVPALGLFAPAQLGEAHHRLLTAHVRGPAVLAFLVVSGTQFVSAYDPAVLKSDDNYVRSVAEFGALGAREHFVADLDGD